MLVARRNQHIYLGMSCNNILVAVFSFVYCIIWCRTSSIQVSFETNIFSLNSSMMNALRTVIRLLREGGDYMLISR